MTPIVDSPRSQRARARAVDGAPTSPADTRLVPVGSVLRAHGVHGALLVRAFGDTLVSLEAGESVAMRSRDSESAERTLTVASVRATHAQLCIVAFREVDDRERAQRCRGSEICVPRERLPDLEPEEYYRADLLGMEVRTLSGQHLGEVTGFLDLPQHDVLVVRGATGELLLPMIEGTIHEIDIAARRMIATPFLDESIASEPSRDARGRRARTRRGAAKPVRPGTAG